MKSIYYLIAAGAMLLAGCSKNQVLVENDQYAIGFDAYTMKATKATPVTNANVTGQGLYVQCYLGDAKVPANYSLYFKDDLDYANSKWDTAPVRYWPLAAVGEVTTPTTKCLSFFAYSDPTDNAGLEYGGTYTTSAYPTLTYTVPALAANQKDIIASVPFEDKAYEDCFVDGVTANGQAHLKFNHILSQIRVKFYGETSIYKYKVTGITIGEDCNDGTNALLKNAGTYTFTATGGSTASTGGTTSYVYPVAAEPVYHTFASSANAIYPDSETATAGSVLMLMPQDLAFVTDTPANTAGIKITYSVTDENDAEIYSGTKRADISNAGALEWENGKCYTYTLKLSSGDYPITYKVEVNDWTDATGIEVNVQ